MIYSSLCYIEKDGCYLMLHRVKKKADVNRDKWIGIGGKFFEDESPFDCVVREAKEETGLDLHVPSYRGVVTFVSDRYETEQMHLFTADGFEGDPIPCDEGDLHWIPRGDVPSLPLWEGDRIFLSLIGDPEAPFFHLKLVYIGDALTEAVLNGQPLRIDAPEGSAGR